MESDKKKCTKCGIPKLLKEFSGIQSHCKSCHNAYNRAFYRTPEGKKRQYESNEAYLNRGDNRVRLKAYYNSPESKAKNKATTKLRTQTQEYKTKRNAKLRKKYKNNPRHKLNIRMSYGIYSGLFKNKKGLHWETLVPYTISELIKHLEKQFKPGMSWDNYGKWHIDHKVPKSKFNFSKPEHSDFQRCWALSNLQPMWARENLLKGAKLTKPFQPSLKI